MEVSYIQTLIQNFEEIWSSLNCTFCANRYTIPQKITTTINAAITIYLNNYTSIGKTCCPGDCWRHITCYCCEAIPYKRKIDLNEY